MLNWMRRACIAASAMMHASAWAQVSDSGAGDGSGLLLLVGLVWLLARGGGDALRRCPVCRHQAPKREFAGRRCPRCNSYEDSFK